MDIARRPQADQRGAWPPGACVLLTDRAWPDAGRERRVLEDAGLRVVEAPAAGEDTLVALARDAVAVMTCFAPVTRAVIESAPHLKVIARFGVGVDNIDLAAATERSVLVTNVPDYCVDEVAEHALALLLCCVRGVARYDRDVRAGGWRPQVAAPLFRLQGRTLGLIGYGRIAQRLAAKVSGLGLRILAYDPAVAERPGASAAVAASGVTLVDLPTLLTESDLVSIHAPLTPSTRHLIDETRLRMMKRGAVLVNASRGGLVDGAALTQALIDGHLAAAGLDVFSTEPLPVDDPLRRLENVVLTPHVAFYSEESLAELRDRAARDVVEVLSGRDVEHVVNADLLAVRHNSP